MANPNLIFLSNEEYESYWDELGGVRKSIAADLAENEPYVILDIACGWGYYTFQLAAARPEGTVVAVDLLASAFTEMEEKRAELGAPSNYQPLVADATSLPLRDGVVDLSTSFLGMRDIYMTQGEEGCLATTSEMIRVIKQKGVIALAVTPPDLADSEELRLAVEIEGEVFGAKSLPSGFYEETYKMNDVALSSTKAYSTGHKLTSDQAKTELRDGLKIASDLYGISVPGFDEVWEMYGSLIEKHGYGMYSKITAFKGTRN